MLEELLAATDGFDQLLGFGIILTLLGSFASPPTNPDSSRLLTEGFFRNKLGVADTEREFSGCMKDFMRPEEMIFPLFNIYVLIFLL